MNAHTLPRGLRMRGSKYFVDVTVNGKRKTGTRDTLAQALELKAELTAALETGKEVRQLRSNFTGWTLQQALDKTLSLPKPAGWRGISYEKQATLNAMDALKFFGPDRQLGSLSLEEIDAWLHDCELRGNADSTINRKRSALSKIADVAFKYKGLALRLELPPQRREPVGRIRQISAAEEAAMLLFFETIERRDMAEFVAVLIDTGMRRGELRNVRPTDVHLKTGVVMVYGNEGRGTKNGKVRSVPMTKRVAAILRERLAGRACFDLGESELRHTWDRARSHLGLSDDKDFTLHVCRHTCASRLVAGGVSLAIVQQWLGHERIETTMRYAHLYPQDLMNAVKALES